ncbi:hypothetical protein ACJX0J_026999, partial [Zea mays]
WLVSNHTCTSMNISAMGILSGSSKGMQEASEECLLLILPMEAVSIIHEYFFSDDTTEQASTKLQEEKKKTMLLQNPQATHMCCTALEENTHLAVEITSSYY